MHPYEKEVQRLAKNGLIGRKIVAVRHLTAEEAEDMGWMARGPVLVLDDGHWIAASMDDEGNDAGALFTDIPGLETIAVVR